MPLTIDSQRAELPSRPTDKAQARFTLMDLPWDTLLTWVMMIGVIALDRLGSDRALTTIRLLIGLPVLLFFPGYQVTAALFARRYALSGIERIGLSFVLSIALVVFACLILYFMHLPITHESLIGALVVLFSVLGALGLIHRATLLPEERFAPWRELRLPRMHSPLDIGVALAIIALVGAGFGAVVYSLMTAHPTEHYTEFSLLNPQTNKAEVPLALTSPRVQGTSSASTYSLTVTVKNEENRSQSYDLEVFDGDRSLGRINTGMLDHDSTWTRVVELPIPVQASAHEVKLDLFLVNGDNDQKPYRELHLWIDSGTNDKLQSTN